MLEKCHCIEPITELCDTNQRSTICLICLTLCARAWFDWANAASTSREESLCTVHCVTVIMAAAARRFSTIVNTITACKNSAGVYLSSAQSSKWKITMRRVMTGLCIAVGGIAVCQHNPVKGVDTTTTMHAVPVVFAREKVRFRKSGKGCIYLLHAIFYTLIIVWSSKQAVPSGLMAVTLSAIQRCWKQEHRISVIEMSTLEQEIHSQGDSTARAEYVPPGFIHFKKIRLNVKRFRIMWLFAYKMLKGELWRKEVPRSFYS